MYRLAPRTLFATPRLRLIPGTLAGWMLAIGLVLRIFHYLSNHTIWYDEAVLLFNILDKDYARLVGPLDHEVAAPPLFVWTLRALGQTVGDHSYAWRALPFLVSCVVLLLSYRIAVRYLPKSAGLALIGLTTFSDSFIWLGCNVKPYIIDAAIAFLLIDLYLASEGRSLPRRLLLFAVLSPFLLILSYASVFLLGSVILAFLPAVWRQRDARSLLSFALLGSLVLGTFAILYFGPIQAQRVSGLVAGWSNKFPNWQRPWSVPGWLAGNFLLVFHYCYNPVGAVAVILAIAGALWCRRTGRLDWLCLLGGPLLLTVIASCIKAYPMSGNRLMLFASPGIGMLIALGVPVAIDWLKQRTRWATIGVLTLLLAPVAGYSAFRVIKPWEQPDSSSISRYIHEERRSGDMVASDEAAYQYFFLGEIKLIKDVAHADLPAGQRVWVPMDHYTPEKRRGYVRFSFRDENWLFVHEVQFFRASAFLFVKR